MDPVRVGVTGHRTVPGYDAVVRAIDAVIAGVPTPARLVTSLAEGADRLVAHAARAHGWTLDVILPLEADDYRADFTGRGSVAEFGTLLDAATTVTVVRPAASRPEAYQAAGLAMLDRSQALIAVWDGQPARGVGGTAEVVAEARRRGMPVAWIHVDRAATDGEGENAPVTVEGWPWDC